MRTKKRPDINRIKHSVKDTKQRTRDSRIFLASEARGRKAEIALDTLLLLNEECFKS